MSSSTLSIASWNVNSIKARLDHVLQWLQEAQPDFLALQETKTIDSAFPVESFANLGYESVYFGQKTYNGVAILTKQKVDSFETGAAKFATLELAEGIETHQARFLRVNSMGLNIIDVYVPNGSEVGSSKYDYKLAWLRALRKYLDQNFSPEDNVIVLGDFNIAPYDIDVYDPIAVAGEILVSEAERQALDNVCKWGADAGYGLLDSFRLFESDGGHYSWWDYRMLAFQKKMGFRIDHIWISKSLEKRCISARIDRHMRKLEKPSDHAPVVTTISLD